MVAVGPWREGGDVFIALLPIIVLLALVLKPKPSPATYVVVPKSRHLFILSHLQEFSKKRNVPVGNFERIPSHTGGRYAPCFSLSDVVQRFMGV